jgi:hypothetical protein
MRTKKITLFLLLLTLFFLSLISNAQDSNDPVFVLDFRLKSGVKKLHDFTIYMGDRTQPQDSVAIGKSKEVYITLKRNEKYSFTFHKEGFYDKVLLINTELPDAVHSDQLFILGFDIEMLPDNPPTRQEGILGPAYAHYDNSLEDFNLYTESH